MKTLKINDLEQVRLLSDPLKLQLLQAFAEGAKTTKQVAKELGESVTKLYRHVDALQDAGLLVVVSEQQKRGTVERTFQTIAERFEVDHTLFSPAVEGGSETVRDILQGGMEEIVAALASAQDTTAGQSQGEQPIFMRLRIKASQQRIDELSRLLQDWLDTAAQDSPNEKPDNKASMKEMGALIAFYPL